MSCTAEYVPQLRARGFRVTSQRMAILHVLRHAHTHMSPAQVHKLARRQVPGLTEPTVYRTLQFLADHRFIQSAPKRGGHLVYQITASQHHHVICTHCGREAEVEHGLLERMYSRLESATGYVINDDHGAFFGLCPRCRKDASEQEGLSHVHQIS